MSVAEAMMCGTPVIAFNKGSMPELIRDGETGFLVDSVDQAIEAVKQISNLQRVNCRDWAVSKFSSEQMVQDYINCYQQILHYND